MALRRFSRCQICVSTECFDALLRSSDPKPHDNIFPFLTTCNPGVVVDTTVDFLFLVAQTVVVTAARIQTAPLSELKNPSTTIQPEITSPTSKNKLIVQEADDPQNEIDNAVIYANTAILFSHHEFSNLPAQTAVQQALNTAEIPKITCKSVSVKVDEGLASIKIGPLLTNLSRDVEVCEKSACTALDTFINTVT